MSQSSSLMRCKKRRSADHTRRSQEGATRRGTSLLLQKRFFGGLPHLLSAFGSQCPTRRRHFSPLHLQSAENDQSCHQYWGILWLEWGYNPGTRKPPSSGYPQNFFLILLDCLISFRAQVAQVALALRLWNQGSSCKYRCMVIPWDVSVWHSPASSQKINQGRRQVVDCFWCCQRCHLMNLLGNLRFSFIRIAEEKRSTCWVNAQSARWMWTPRISCRN